MLINVVGVDDALRELRNYNKVQYATIRKTLMAKGKPLAAQIGMDFPSDNPLRNWHPYPPRRRRSNRRAFPVYDGAVARSQTKAKFGVGRSKNVAERRLMRVEQMSAGGAVLEKAGSGVSNSFVKNLDQTQGGRSTVGRVRSRVLYMAVKKRKPAVEAIVAEATLLTDKVVTAHINRKL
tara:strand:+ start:6084 stop:6620 length:537 start_codon:yes stop_codon:yes gene_type:complete